MKKTKTYVILILICIAVGIGFSDDAHWVKKNVFYSPQDEPSRPNSTIIFKNGLGITIEEQRLLNLYPQKTIITGFYRDENGRDSITVKPYVVYNPNGYFLPIKDFALIDGANNYYNGTDGDHRPDAENYAYTERRYWPDGTIKEIGNPGKEFSLYISDPPVPGSNGKHVKKWNFMINLSFNDVLDQHGFIIKDYLNDEFLSNYYNMEIILPPVKRICDKQEQDTYFTEDDDGSRWIYNKVIYEYDYSTGSVTEAPQNEIGDIVFVEVEDKYYRYEGDQGNENWHEIEDLQSDLYLYILTVVKDENDHYSQIITDKFGRIIKRCNDLNSKRIVSQVKYDIIGNVNEELPPDPDISSTLAEDYKISYQYNSKNQLIKKITVDRGTERFRYDKRGNLRFIKTAIHSAYEEISEDTKEFFLANEYDKYNRLIAKKEVIVPYSGTGARFFDNPNEKLKNLPVGSEVSDKIINIYNRITKEKIEFLAPNRDATLLQHIVDRVAHSKGRLVATTVFQENNDNIINIFSYTDKGVNNLLYRFIPNIPVQKDSICFGYNSEIIEQLKYRESEVDNGIVKWKYETRKKFNYDPELRLEGIKINGKRIINYQYTENGIMNQKILYKQDGTELEKISYKYNIADLLTDIETKNNTNLFNEHIYYNNSPENGFYSGYKNLYNGNVSGIKVSGLKGDNAETYLYNNSYIYDEMGRLTDVYQGTNEDPFEHYSFDNMSRLTNKHEYQTEYNDYTYKEYEDQTGRVVKTNQLAYIQNSPKGPIEVGGSVIIDNYLYDPNGNMVLDRSKKMVIVYDWRDMPILFKFYDYIPVYDNNNNPFTWNTLSELDSRNDVNLKVEIEMLYDASGERVQKLIYIVENQ